MTGARRRRGSTSSLETVDENHIRRLHETSIIKIPATADLNEWPTFEIRDAVVLNNDGKTLENALHVAKTGPFIIRGNLVIDDRSQSSHCEYTRPVPAPG